MLARIDATTTRVCFRVDGCASLPEAEGLRLRFIKRGRGRPTQAPCPLRLCECPEYVITPPPEAEVIALTVAEIFADGRVCSLVPPGWAAARKPGRYWVRLERDETPIDAWCGQVEIGKTKRRVRVETESGDGCGLVCETECADDSGGAPSGSGPEERPLW